MSVYEHAHTGVTGGWEPHLGPLEEQQASHNIIGFSKSKYGLGLWEGFLESYLDRGPRS